MFLNESLESIHSKIGDVVNVKSYGSSMIPIPVDGPWKDVYAELVIEAI